MKSPFMITPSRLEWACKRGMLECELFLKPLIQQAFRMFSDCEKEQLYALLQLPDPLLYEWFMGVSLPKGPYEHFQSLVDKIRCHPRF